MTNVVPMPPRNNKQALIAQLRKFIEQAEKDEICSMAVVICRDDSADPPTTHYRYNDTMALIGAVAVSAHMIMDDVPEEEQVS